MDSKIAVRQISNESEAWKRTLAFLSQECSFLKLVFVERLNTIDVTPDFLETAELYQNRLVREDEIIKLMLHEISEFEALLKREVYEDGAPLRVIISKQKHSKSVAFR